MRPKLRVVAAGFVVFMLVLFSASAAATLPHDHPLRNWYDQNAYVPPVHTGFYIYPEDRFHQGHGFIREPRAQRQQVVDIRQHPDYPHFHRDHPHLIDPTYHTRGAPHQDIRADRRYVQPAPHVPTRDRNAEHRARIDHRTDTMQDRRDGFVDRMLGTYR